KIKAAIQAGRDDIAEQYAIGLEKSRESLARTREQLKYASAAYDKALQVKKTFMPEKDRKIAEAKEALRAHERAKWQAKIADTLEQFEVAGVDATHDEMLNRVNEMTARNEARMEMALDSIDTEALQIEEDAQEIQAAELVKQFKLEMGLAEPAPRTAAPEPELRIPEAEQTGGDAGPAERRRERTE